MDAYMNPEVDTSKAPFRWSDPNLEGLRSMLKYKLGWEDSKVDTVILPVIKRSFELKHGKKQPKIDTFFKPIVNPHKSKRVQNAFKSRQSKRQKQ
jgi:hypothetical protein